MNLLKNFSPVLLGLMMVIFGMNKFIGFIPVEPPADATAQMFMGAMFSSYLYIVVAMLEVGAGIMLFIPKTRFVGWLLLIPVIFNITAFHLAHDFIGNGIWLVPLVLMLVIGYQLKSKVFTLVKVTI